VVIAGDDIEEGKPHPSPFQTALQRMNLKPSEAIVVENAPLGVEAAIRAGIEYIVTLNNTPLDISSDFKGITSFVDREKDKIFKDTKSASNFLKRWCCY
ncbi:MAG TPA: HAD-IA family hydrolase, partial [Nitrososphaeraceae archaeon]|jgi:beta-phosphoglucomutase|nr:HAD-IA family hydrolase [Nitrososphaeraceae archaeon]